MKRILSVGVAVTFGIFAMTYGTSFAQGNASNGFPPQTDLYNDAVLLARVLPLIAALGIGFGIWQAKASLREPKSTPGSATVIRHDLGAVIAHWTNGVGFIIGMITGLIVLRWLPRPDEMRIIFAIHYIGSGLALFGVAGHLTQNAITGGMGLLPRSFKDFTDGITDLMEQAGIFGPSGAVFRINLPRVIRDTLKETVNSFGFKQSKRLGKYLPAEKVFSYTPWAIIIVAIVVTGIIKSFRYLYPIPPDFIAQVSVVHDFFAYCAVGMLGIHLIAVLLVPHHWRLLLSMFTTRISRKYVQQFLPLWEKELIAREQASATTTPETKHVAEQQPQSAE
ncbi:MAG: cytochrome b/b6 domain-containing protein [Chloroflexi bacterium]|nr:cytochrome b/b6 domain-containing protein [Chloroflexota bacterium]